MDPTLIVGGAGMGTERCQRMARGHAAEMSVCNAVRGAFLAQIPALRGCEETLGQKAHLQADIVGNKFSRHNIKKFMWGGWPLGLQLTLLDAIFQS